MKTFFGVVIFGLLMIIFMIYEPLGMAKLWENIKQSVRSKLFSSGTKRANSPVLKKWIRKN